MDSKEDLFKCNVPDFIEAVFGDVGDLLVGAVFLVVEDREGGVEVEEDVEGSMVVVRFLEEVIFINLNIFLKVLAKFFINNINISSLNSSSQ